MQFDKNPIRIQKMFDEISSSYDEMNNLMSLWTHKLIKILAVNALEIKPNSTVLDLCCGTGDLTKIIGTKARVIGLDFSKEMIKTAKKKNPKKVFILGDCTELFFKNNEFDYITMSFGLRNIENRQKALKEAYRVLKKGGKFLHLDFGKQILAEELFDSIIPILAEITGKSFDNYKYLIDSKNDYPEPEELIKEFENCGFKFIKRKDFLFGAVSAQIMGK